MKPFILDLRFQFSRLRRFLTNPTFRRYHLRKRSPLRWIVAYLTREVSKQQFNLLFSEQPETEYCGKQLVLCDTEDPQAAMAYFRVMYALAQTDNQKRHALERIDACLETIHNLT